MYRTRLVLICLRRLEDGVPLLRIVPVPTGDPRQGIGGDVCDDESAPLTTPMSGCHATTLVSLSLLSV
jgi:hypothetical protein